MREQTYQIGIVQAKFTNGDVSGNLERMKRIVEQTKAAHPHVRVILFAELAVTGYHLSETILNHTEPADGGVELFMGKVARENDVYIGYGYAEAGEQGQVYNAMHFLNRHGHPIANYRKIHLTNLERDLFTPGDEIVVADTELGKIGFAICWDLAFPELARSLAIRGAELLLVPTAWERPYDDSFLRFAQARAIDNTVYLAASNQIGESGELAFFGKSGFIGPDGSFIASSETDEETVIIGEVDLEHRKTLQSSFFTMLQERRKDLYALKEER